MTEKEARGSGVALLEGARAQGARARRRGRRAAEAARRPSTTSTASSRSKSSASASRRRRSRSSRARRGLQAMSENAAAAPRARALPAEPARRRRPRVDCSRSASFDDRQLITAAEVARRNELYDRAINTADRTESMHDFSLRYLAPYRDVLQARTTAQLNLDEAWVYGLIRQESRFIVERASRAGASGLMQLMPATAKWVARRSSGSRTGAGRRDRGRHQREPRHLLPAARARHARRPAGARVRRLQRRSGPRARVAARRRRSKGRSTPRPSRSTRRATT